MTTGNPDTGERWRVGVDVGGTFTDLALVNDATGAMSIHKQLTTPQDPSRAVLAGLETLLARAGVAVGEVATVAHGTTLVTNAVIERRGAKTGMLVTRGFRDVLDIAMERRFDLFDLSITFADPVVPRELRLEVDERIRYDGAVETPLDPDQVERATHTLVEEHGIEALALCFLHSYVDDRHEAAAREVVAARFPGLMVTTSSEILPFMREYERWSTTTVNAYVQPLTDRYLRRLEDGLARMGFAGSLLIMTASGGMVTPAIARRFPVRLIESGPAAGALVAAFLGEQIGEGDLLSFDMGGTTAKGALIRNGRPLRRYEFEVARSYNYKAGSGLPLRIPVIDMIEIGAGGGSIARVDDRGLLAVGPYSAGADPGPACYATGGDSATLTDANLALGYLESDAFLGGRMTLDARAADGAIETRVAGPLGISLDRAAWGIHEVINEDVARAFRMHASEIGFDYRRCAMIAFGGSGPAHAVRVARKLRIPRVILPVGAGVMSAIGLLTTPVSYATLRSGQILLEDLDAGGIENGFRPVIDQATGLLAAAGIALDDMSVERRLDMRFHGQGHEVEVVCSAGISPGELGRSFLDAYAAIYAATPIDAAIEIVNWKVEASGPSPEFARGYKPFPGASGTDCEVGSIDAWDPQAGERRRWPVLDRYALEPGQTVVGPALVREDEATTVLGPGDSMRVDSMGNLVVTLAEEEA